RRGAGPHARRAPADRRRSLRRGRVQHRSGHAPDPRPLPCPRPRPGLVDAPFRSARLSMAVIDITTFRLRDGVDDVTFLRADERVRPAVLYQQPGLVRATTARGSDGGWVL